MYNMIVSKCFVVVFNSYYIINNNYNLSRIRLETIQAELDAPLQFKVCIDYMYVTQVSNTYFKN